jgi:hypothetical protein
MLVDTSQSGKRLAQPPGWLLIDRVSLAKPLFLDDHVVCLESRVVSDGYIRVWPIVVRIDMVIEEECIH